MADYIAHARSNYFKVKSQEQFRAFCERYDLEIIDVEGNDGAKRFGFMIYESLPRSRYDDNGELIDVDFIGELSEQLADGEVAVVMEVGHMKMSFLHGYAWAVNSQGKVVEVDLQEIYERAEKAFGVLPSEAEY